MQFSISMVITFLAGVATVRAGCDLSTSGGGYDEDCCWGKDGYSACTAQIGGEHGRTVCYGAEKQNFCSAKGIDCGADCCSVSTGWGKGCPK